MFVPLLFLGLLALVIWAVTRERLLRDSVARLEARLVRAERELADLRQTPAGNPAPSPTVPPPPVEPEPRAPDTEGFPVRLQPPPLPFIPDNAPSPAFAQAGPATFDGPVPPPRRLPAFNWEQFVGVKLVSWVAGLALFLAAAFGLKYSFEQNLIPPALRATAGFLLGAGLLVAGVILRRREYAVTAQTLVATGVVILYAVTFACRSLYHFAPFSAGLTFAVMTAVTVVAFGLAVRLDAQVVAVLGMLGGFLSPVLVSTGENNPVGLFGYLVILDLGLLAVVWRKRWEYLALAAVAGTVLMELGWFLRFYDPTQLGVLQVILPGFAAVFLASFAAAVRQQRAGRLSEAAVAVQPLAALALGFFLVGSPDLAAMPGRVFWIVFTADAALLGAVFLRPSLRTLEGVGGGALFLLVGIWASAQLNAGLLRWGLGLVAGFALLHTAFPVLLRRLRPAGVVPASVGSQLFPALALILVVIPLMKALPVGPLFWAVVVLVDALAVVLALLSGALLGLIAVVILTFALAGVWLNASVHELADSAETLLVIGGFGVFLTAAGAGVSRQLGRSNGGSGTEDPRLRTLAPVLSATLPFLLLIMLVQRLQPANPSAIFGVAAGLCVALLALVRWSGIMGLLPAGLAATGLLQWAWLSGSFRPEAGVAVPLIWLALFTGLFTGFPFLFARRLAASRMPWAVAALAGVVHCPLALALVWTGLPGVPPGLVPAAFSLPVFAGLAWMVRRLPAGEPARLPHLAWFAGVGLFFVTLIFPVQFERQWITLGWALEGAALCWLFRRLPHPGLRATGVGLLVAAFARLALNPAVLGYHPPTGVPIFNWHLYTYGISAACLLGAVRLLAPPRERVCGTDVRPLLATLGTVLAFLLVNLEIADYFATGPVLTFEFSGNLARDLAYTVAWALFALGLIVVGVARRVRAARYAGLALLGVVVLKLFLHDLARLGPLHRIIAFAAVALIALAASVLYQRFLARPEKAAPAPER